MKRILLTLTLLGSLASFAADMVNPSWTASNNIAGQSATYTFSYKAVTANPNMVLYALLNTNPTPSFNFNLASATVTVNGTSAAINTSSSWATNDRFVLRLTNSAIVTAGANIVVTISATNSPNGTYTWNWIRSADGGGNEIDGYRNPPSITIGTLSTIDSEVNKNTFTISPNPASDVLQIETNKNLFISNLEIYNLYGASVKQFSPNVGNFKVNINDLPNGVYFVRINSNEKDPFVRKIVVRH